MKPSDKFKWFPQVHSLLSEFEEQFQIQARFLKPIIREFMDTTKQQADTLPLFQLAKDEFIRLFKQQLESHLREYFAPSLRRVINATGVILHTGLGRAPYSPIALERFHDVCTDYCNIEFDLVNGNRGERQHHVRHYLKLLTGADESLVVNNNAAAVFLALHALAPEKEVIISRGELVEIGGSFRMPDIMSQAGSLMKEIGTTNRTHLRDYEEAINENTGMILKVHPSNFRIAGFTHKPGLDELVALAHEHHLPFVYDLGGGALADMTSNGLPHEDEVADLIDAGVDVISFSGDKLPGGPQCGILVGRREFLRTIHRNPLYRTYRVDKAIMALLEGTLRGHLSSGSQGPLPVVYQLANRSITELKSFAKKIIRGIASNHNQVYIEESSYQMGSGAMPARSLPSVVLRFNQHFYPPEKLAAAFRQLEVPIVGYIDNQHYYWNLRTLRETDLTLLRQSLKTVLEGIKDA